MTLVVKPAARSVSQPLRSTLITGGLPAPSA